MSTTPQAISTILYQPPRNHAMPRTAVLAVLPAGGWVEIFGERHIDVRIVTMPRMTTPEGERLADEYLGLTLPRRYREIFWPGNRRAADMVRTITPQDIVQKKWEMKMCRTIDAITARQRGCGMDHVSTLLDQAREAGLIISADNGNLRIEGAVNDHPALMKQISHHTPDILASINGEPVPPAEDHQETALDHWPDPLATEAYHGLAGEIVRVIEPHSESDPVALLVQVLIAFGNLIERSAYFRAEADRHHGNLFAVLVGVTAKGRKGSSWGQVRRLVHLADPEWCEQHIAGGLSSGEGLIWAVRDPIVKSEPIREGSKRNGPITGYQEVVTDEGVADKRLLVMEGEFSSVLQVCAREKNTLSAVIRQVWDSGDLRSLVKNAPARATGAHISIVGHITRDELRRLITATDMANGLANRFRWLCVQRSKALPEGGDLREHMLTPLADRLRDSVEFARRTGELRRDETAREVWHKVYADLSAGKPGLLGAATSRAESQVMRLAMLYALLDQSEVIRAEHLMAGLAVWTYAEQSARYIFGSAMGDPVADEILRELRQRLPDGMKRVEIRDHFSRHQSKERIGGAMELLHDCGLIRCDRIETTGGRPAEVWFAHV